MVSSSVADAPVPPAVRVRDLTYAYRKRTALSDLSFAVAAGEIFGFLGPNGGGKSTLFRILATLTPPQNGEVEILGEALPERAATVRRRIGVVFQSPSLDLQLRVDENLRHHGNLYGLRGAELRRRIDQQLERFDLTSRRRDKATELSGGLRRRVELAKALLPEPELLLLDEPSTGLDPGARRELWDTLESLRDQERVTVLLTTHFMEEGDRCDRLALLDRGHLVAEGTPENLKSEIGGEVVQVEVERPEGFLAELEGRLGVDATLMDGQIRYEHSHAHLSVARLAEAFPGRIEAVRVARPTLEDVFVRRTGHGLWEGE
jgi:ABC-2 type transport system ATP-binding protein